MRRTSATAPLPSCPVTRMTPAAAAAATSSANILVFIVRYVLSGGAPMSIRGCPLQNSPRRLDRVQVEHYGYQYAHHHRRPDSALRRRGILLPRPPALVARRAIAG